jgi:hypothetical protein
MQSDANQDVPDWQLVHCDALDRAERAQSVTADTSDPRVVDEVMNHLRHFPVPGERLLLGKLAGGCKQAAAPRPPPSRPLRCAP